MIEQADSNGMLYPVRGNISEVISHYYHIYHHGTGKIIKHLSPSLEIMMIFNFGTPVLISFNNAIPEEEVGRGCVVIGPLRKMLNYELSTGAEAIVVNFKLNGFYRLFKVPLNYLAGETLYDPDKLAGRYKFSTLWKQVSLISDLQARIEMISSYVVHFVEENDVAVQPLLRGEHYFYESALQPVKAIAADSSLTQRTIQLRFRKYAGYSPKELIRFLRFKLVLDWLLTRDDQQVDIFEVILAFGYHDQSHLIKDFKYYLGTTPQPFLTQLKGKEFFVTGHGPKYKDSFHEDHKNAQK